MRKCYPGSHIGVNNYFVDPITSTQIIKLTLRQEIWDALKAAAEALETGNRDLAQAILDGASITLPSGEKLCSNNLVFQICFKVSVIPNVPSIIEY